MQVGSRALVTLRHSLSHFDQIRIVLRLILVNPEWRWFLKRQILHFQRWNHIWIHIWELYTWSRLREKKCRSWAPFFSTSGHSRPKFDQPRTKVIWKKWNYGFKNIKWFFDTHLRDIGGFLSSRNVEAFFGPFRSNSYLFRVDSGKPRMKVIFEKKILHLQIWNHIWIPIWELYTWLRAKTCTSWAPFL